LHTSGHRHNRHLGLDCPGQLEQRPHNKASDAMVKSLVSSAIVELHCYADEKWDINRICSGGASTFSMLKPCNGKPIINISPDGKNLAIFIQSCTDSKNYIL